MLHSNFAAASSRTVPFVLPKGVRMETPTRAMAKVRVIGKPNSSLWFRLRRRSGGQNPSNAQPLLQQLPKPEKLRK
jgi:hypothetical protein